MHTNSKYEPSDGHVDPWLASAVFVSRDCIIDINKVFEVGVAVDDVVDAFEVIVVFKV